MNSVKPMSSYVSGDVALDKFLQSKDVSTLADAPLVFETTPKFTSLLCCQGVAACVGTFGFSLCCCPIGTFCPGQLLPYHKLQVRPVIEPRLPLASPQLPPAPSSLDPAPGGANVAALTSQCYACGPTPGQCGYLPNTSASVPSQLNYDSVQFEAAANDCCFHIAKTQKMLPLEKIQDVQLTTGCCETCFGLQTVRVETAAGAGMPEVFAPFLKDPQRAREALQVAVRAYRSAPGVQPGMSRSGGGGGGLQGRLQRLDRLVDSGALSKQEAADMRVGVLAAEQDPTPLLLEAVQLRDSHLITPAEFERLIAKLASRAKAS